MLVYKVRADSAKYQGRYELWRPYAALAVLEAVVCVPPTRCDSEFSVRCYVVKDHKKRF